MKVFHDENEDEEVEGGRSKKDKLKSAFGKGSASGGHFPSKNYQNVHGTRDCGSRGFDDSMNRSAQFEFGSKKRGRNG